jgi:hypothetical protein
MHIPLLQQTFHDCSTEFFDAIFVNTSCGDVADTTDRRNQGEDDQGWA